MPGDASSLTIVTRGMIRQKGIQSVEIGCDLLQCLGRLRHAVSLTELATELGMSPSKAYFYVTSFVRKGFVAKSDDGLYRLGPTALHLGLSALAQIDAVEEARAAMVRIRSSVDQSMILSVWGSAGPTVVHRLPAAGWQLELRLGAVLSPFTATGRALLTAFPEEILDALVRDELAQVRPTDPWRGFSQAKMMKIVLDDQRRGVSRGFGSVYPGATSLAAPVRDQTGQTVAAITVIGGAADFDTRYEGPVAKALLKGIRGISV
jgi:DNA-binding IclR family transcriptional regulator